MHRVGCGERRAARVGHERLVAFGLPSRPSSRSSPGAKREGALLRVGSHLDLAYIIMERAFGKKKEQALGFGMSVWVGGGRWTVTRRWTTLVRRISAVKVLARVAHRRLDNARGGRVAEWVRLGARVAHTVLYPLGVLVVRSGAPHTACCFEHRLWTRAPSGGPDAGPVGSRATRIGVVSASTGASRVGPTETLEVA